MTHGEVDARLGAYLAGELSAEEQIRLERHVGGCPSCAAELSQLRTTVRLLRSLPELPPPPGLADSVMSQLRTQEAQRRPWSRAAGWLRELADAPVVTPLAAFAVGLCAIAIVRSVDVSIEVLWPGPAATPAVEVTNLRPAPPPAVAGNVPPTAAVRRVAMDRAASRPPLLLRPRLDSGFGARIAAPEATLSWRPLPPLSACGEALSGWEGEPTAEVETDCYAWLGWMLALARSQPLVFLTQVDSIPERDREAWIGGLVGFADSFAASEEVAERLRAVEDPRAVDLAPRFELVRGGATPR